VPTVLAVDIGGTKMAAGLVDGDGAVPRATAWCGTSGGWASPDFETAQDRVDISVEGGFGSVKVV